MLPYLELYADYCYNVLMFRNQSTTTAREAFDPGREIYSWEAVDYHPHERSWIWITVFSVFMFGVAIWSFLSDPTTGWITALTLLLALAMYFQTHRNGDEKHTITVFENGFFIDQYFISHLDFEGFWFLYDETVSLVNFEKKGKGQGRIKLQMGNVSPDKLREVFSELEMQELTDKREEVVDLWIRALKL